MIIDFTSSKIQKELTERKRRQRSYGEQADLILRRLQQLEAADTLQDFQKLPQVGCHELTGDRKGHFACNLRQPYRLIFRPHNSPIPLKPDGGIDLSKVDQVTVLEIVDYH